MKLIEQNLKNLRGNVINYGSENITLFSSIETALLATPSDITEEEKRINYKLLKRFINQKEVEVEIEDLAIIKKCIGKNMITEVMGACFEILEK